MDEYVIGTGNVPGWCRNLVMQYQKIDGSVGYELYGTMRDIELNEGDRIVRQGSKIFIRRKKENNCKRVYKAVKKA